MSDFSEWYRKNGVNVTQIGCIKILIYKHNHLPLKPCENRWSQDFRKVELKLRDFLVRAIMKERHVARRKKRTREHIIADLSENHFEKIALKKGFSVERTAHDYGYDVFLFSYDANGEIENGYISVQLKATDSLPLINGDSIVSFTVDKRDLDLWLKEFNPVVLVVYDVPNEKAYWLYIQAYFQALAGFDLANIGKSMNVHIPLTNKIGKGALTRFAAQKTKLYNQIQNIQHSI